MKQLLCVALLHLSLFGLSSKADSLTDIAAFAEKICSQTVAGSETSTTIEGKLNGDVSGLAKALGLTVSAGALVKRDGTKYEGIPKDKLPASIATPAQCKLEVAKMLIAERQQLATNSNPH